MSSPPPAAGEKTLIPDIPVKLNCCNSIMQMNIILKKICTNIITISLFYILIVMNPLNAAHVFLKDGSILKCEIIKDEAQYIIIEKENNIKVRIGLNRILRILYTEIYMGKQYVQKVDGTVIESYMVDRNQKTYTFRNKLSAPVEYIIKREEVLFITRTNPTGLLARASKDRVRLSWFPPYMDVKSFRIYMKTKKDNTYKLIDETSGKNYTVKNLKINHQYYFIVTAVDDKDYESLPCNEATVITGIRAGPPEGLSLQTEITDNGKELIVQLKWNTAAKKENITGYRIYAKTNRGVMKYGETANNYITINRLSPGIVYYFFITAVDNKGNESEDSRRVRTGVPLVIHYRMGYSQIFGEMDNYLKHGYGMFLSCYTNDLFTNNLDFGLDIGFIYHEGKLNPIRDLYTYPVLIMFQYNFSISKTLSITPKIAAGYCYKKIKYNDMESTTVPEGNYFNKGFSPIMLGSLTLYWNFWQMFHFQLSSEYLPVFENDGIGHITLFSLGFGFTF